MIVGVSTFKRHLWAISWQPVLIGVGGQGPKGKPWPFNWNTDDSSQLKVITVFISLECANKIKAYARQRCTCIYFLQPILLSNSVDLYAFKEQT